MSAGVSPADKKWRILCIDDDPDVLLILHSTLGIRHEVVTAKNGVEAVAMLDTCDADFIICDVRMPTMDGFQTVEAIRRHPAYFDVPVFFLTAETDRRMAQRGFKSGANLYLTKPFDPMRLLKNVDYFLQESGQQPRPKRLTPDAATRMATTAPPAPVAPTPQPAPPLQASEPSARTAQKAPQPPAAPAYVGRPRIVVICADRPQLKRIHDALEEDFECVACADALASLQQLFRYEPDVLMINPAMPRLSGWGLVQMIRQNPKLRGIHIILLEDARQAVDRRLAPAITAYPPLSAAAAPEAILAAVHEVAHAKGFAVRPKLSAFDALVKEEEELRRRLTDEEQRQRRQDQSKTQRYRRIQEFIDKQMG